MEHKSARRAPSTAPDARVLRTRAALRAALLALVARKPLDQITIRDLVAQADTGYATFFRHYASKAALVDDVAAEQIADLIQRALPLLSVGDARPAALALCRYVDERRALWTALLTGGAAGTMREEFIRQASAIAAAQPKPQTSLPGDLPVIFGVVAAVEILAWWLQKGRSVSVEEIAAIIDRLVIAPTFGGT